MKEFDPKQESEGLGDTIAKFTNATGLDKVGFRVEYYCLRHSYATFRLYAGVDPYVLARNMGTSITFLENHYGQVQTRKLRDELTKDLSTKMMKELREEN